MERTVRALSARESKSVCDVKHIYVTYSIEIIVRGLLGAPSEWHWNDGDEPRIRQLLLSDE